MKKIIFILVVAITVVVGTVAVMAGTGNERRWYFTEDKFDALYNILSENVTIDGLTIGKGMDINTFEHEIRNIKFYKSVYTPEGGDTSNGYIKFYVNGNTDIHILGSSKVANYSRKLTIYSTADNNIATISMLEANDYKYEYRGSAGYVYLYTSGGGVRIYGITAKEYVADEYTPMGENEKKEWNFNNYKSLMGNITQSLNLDGLKIKATLAKPTEISSSVGYNEYGNLKPVCFNFSGTGMYDSRNISFPVPRNSDIYITARSGDGKSERPLIISNVYFGTPNINIKKLELDDKNENELFINVNGNQNTYKISYFGSGEDFMLYSYDSGIKIYDIKVVPRINKLTEDKSWIINNYPVGRFENDNIDGLETYNINIENCNIGGYSKRIIVKSDTYGIGGSVKFKISDSSGERGSYVKRTISITANTELAGTKLILVNSEDYVIGSVDLSADIKEYKFDYNGPYDEICCYTYYSHNTYKSNSYIYSINNGTLAEKNPNDAQRTINVIEGQSYQYYFTAENVAANIYKYKITFNPNALSVKYIGYGDGSNNFSTKGIEIISNANGEIVFTIDKTYTKWSGITASVIFQAKSTGSTTINYIADVK